MLTLDEEDEHLRARTYFNQSGRPTVAIDGRRVQLSRLILSLAGMSLFGLVVDHVSGDILDNRKTNLRPCSRSDNACNRHKHQTSNPGVVYNPRCGKRPYHVQISYDGMVYSLPRISDRERAIAIRNHVAIRVQGQFAVIQLTSYRLSQEDIGWIDANMAVKPDHRKRKLAA
jgi:hypothetical protein